jgi:hypothetical protein
MAEDGRAARTAVAQSAVLETGARRARDLGWPRFTAVLFLLVLNAADAATTSRVIRLGGVERNPLAHWFLDHGWLLEAKLGAVGLLGILLLIVPPRRWLAPALWTAVAVYGFVVANNLVQLSRA